MIGYVTLGTNNLQKAAPFYDAIAKEFGGTRTMEMGDGFIAWGSGAGPMVSLIKPYDGKAATVGNGVMVGLAASSKEQVDRVHATALANGGTCEGPPGQRMDGFYAAYFRDTEGNKRNAFYMG